MDRTIVLSTAYLPPVQYFTKFILGNKILIEDDENFTKQTYRNRCLIAGPNGVLSLTIPVQRGSFHKTHIRDIKIDYGTSWLENHKRAFRTAYASSPFYEYYIVELLGIPEKKPVFLLDLNTMLLDLLLGFLCLEKNYDFTHSYVSDPATSGIMDLRNTIGPKSAENDPYFSAEPYEQVFDEKSGFLSNLSIVDLLFNTGPDAGIWVKSSIASENG